MKKYPVILIFIRWGRLAILGIFILLIRFYQIFISPFLPQSCNYRPSCSEYALISFRKHGVLAGFDLSLRRLLRCHPFCQGGEDHVPDRYSFFRHKHHG